MPEDVPLGAGYIGSILHDRFPGEYGDAGDMAVQEFDTSGHYAQAPGAVMGQPRATDPAYGQPQSAAYGQPPYTPGGRVLTDPDVGRELEMKEIPGIGMVAMPAGQHEQFASSLQGMDAVVPVDYPQAGEGEGWGVGNLGAVVPADHYLAGQQGIGDWRGTPFGGMGGFTESIGSLVAGSDLDALNKSMFKLQDSLVDAYDKLNSLELDRQKLAERTAKYPTFIPVPGAVVAIPTPMGIVNLETAGALKEGYAALTGFTYMIASFRNSFGQAAPQMRRVYNAIDSMLVTMDNWIRTWDERVKPRKGQLALFDQIQSRHNQLYAGVTGMAMDFNNDAYLPTAMKAVEEVTGLKSDEAGMSGLGIGPLVLVAIIVAAVAFVAIAITVLAIVSEFNTKARILHEQRTAYEKDMVDRRKAFMEKCAAEGRNVSDCEAEWTKIKTGEDQKQDKKEDDFAKRTPGTDWGDILGKALLPVAAVVGVALVATQVIPELF